MKGSTYFRPSIHGWPFSNSWDWSFTLPVLPIEIDKTGIGFCGGMCWTALDRFYGGEPIPRDLSAPAPTTDLYDEIMVSQISSVGDANKLMAIYEWQMSPRLSGHWGNPHTSQGKMTQQQWKVNVRKQLTHGSPQDNKPVTLTMIVSANDYDPGHLTSHHRIIVYGFEERELYAGEYVHGAKNPDIRHITLYIYDPNIKNNDGVCLTFYTNCDDDWIHIQHSKDKDITGFFMDDKPRAYPTAVDPSLQIDRLEMAELTSLTRAKYNLEFSWQARTVPYFCVEIDGVPWKDNAAAKASLLPAAEDIKQSPSPTGSQTIELDLPRDPTEVAVRFLENEDLTSSITSASSEPYFHVTPYYWSRNEKIKEADFTVKDKNPSAAELQSLMSTPSRIASIQFPAAYTDSEVAFPWQDLLENDQLTPEFFSGQLISDQSLPARTYLGNIQKGLSVKCDLRNLAPPVQLWTTRYTIKPGSYITDSLPLTADGNLVFEGFSPADYEADTEVRFLFNCRDDLGVYLSQELTIHGKSVLQFYQNRVFPELPPLTSLGPRGSDILDRNIAKYEAVAHYLVEIGLVDFKMELDPVRAVGSARGTLDPGGRDPRAFEILKAVRADRRIQKIIKDAARAVWQDQDLWNSCLKENAKELKEAYPERFAAGYRGGSRDHWGDVLDLNAEIRSSTEAGLVSAFAERTIQELERDPEVKRKLDDL